MNREEAKKEFERMKSSKYAVNHGFLWGATAMIAFLGLSFIEPYLEYILVMSLWPIIGIGIYTVSQLLKFRKIEKVLQDSEGSETE